jgi:hypothetical protein
MRLALWGSLSTVYGWLFQRATEEGVGSTEFMLHEGYLLPSSVCERWYSIFGVEIVIFPFPSL